MVSINLIWCTEANLTQDVAATKGSTTTETLNHAELPTSPLFLFQVFPVNPARLYHNHNSRPKNISSGP